MKKCISLLLTLCMFFACAINVSAASASNFTDVGSGDWFYSAVNFVTENGMFSGTGPSTFSPFNPMTRGMVVTVLGRYGGAPAIGAGNKLGVITKSDVNMRSAPSTSGTSVLASLGKNTQLEVLGSTPDLKNAGFNWFYVKYKGILGYIRSDLMSIVDSGFADVPSSAYYSSYVRWATDAKIASGTGNGNFSPDLNITREELCSMLFNYADFKNIKLNPTLAPVNFLDSSSISPAYAHAVSSLQQLGVINGCDDGTFKPQGSATRAEVAAMLMRFVSAISYHPDVPPTPDGNYVFGTEVPVKASVNSDYFSDACFIGHSITLGMKNYFNLNNADFFAVNGISTRKLLEYQDFELSTTHTDEYGKVVHDKGSLDKAISENYYGKVYIMLGVNETGPAPYHRQAFSTAMGSLIDIVRKSQPNATIYLLSETPVSEKCSEERTDINRDNILAFNNVIKQLCRDKKTYYLNVFDLLADSNGYLPEDACLSDGIHILSPQYAQIKSYIFSHTV
ncbi:MAG: S-layer homology domain-containing protein [Oscillospiraceae bacterium]